MKQDDLVILIYKYLRPCDTMCKFSSYALKHIFEKISNDYISNYEFKQAMWKAGVIPCKIVRENYYYKISVVDVPEIPTNFLVKKRFRNGRI